jgi:hypothetical protein
MSPLETQANLADPKEIAIMEAGHQKVEGVVTDLKSGVYTVKTSTGTKYYTLAEPVAIRYGRDVLRVGDEMILWVNDGNMVMDAIRKGTSIKTRFISGRLVSINYGRSQMTLSMSEGEKSFRLRPESRMFKDIAIGTLVTIILNEAEEVTDLQTSRTSDVPLSGLNHPENNSALIGFRHLGKPE